MSLAAERRSAGYQSLLVGLLSVNLGLVFFDRAAFTLLAPMVQPELGLTNTQVGTIIGGLAAGWAMASLIAGRRSDVTGQRKPILVWGTVIFSLASVSSGFAGSFAVLLGVRLLMGLAEGAVVPVSQVMVAMGVSEEHRGLAQGALLAVSANLVAGVLGPLVIVGVGTAYGWRHAFWIAGIPGLITAGLIYFLIYELPVPAHRPARASARRLFRHDNLRVAVLLAVLIVSAGMGVASFLPLYFVREAGLSQHQMSTVLAAMAPLMLLWGILCPALSDRLGRKPVLIGALLLSAPAGYFLLFNEGSFARVLAGAVLASFVGGAIPLIMSIIPAEAVDEHEAGTALGLNVATAEIVGGALAPILTGSLADRYGLSVIPWLMVILTLLPCVIALGLRESAPRKLASRKASLDAMIRHGARWNRGIRREHRDA